LLENGLFIIEFKKGEVFSMSAYTFPKAWLGDISSYQASTALAAGLTGIEKTALTTNWSGSLRLDQ